jgi:WD40 repeat protein
MGVVYKARQLRLNRLVALKMILAEHATPAQRARFRAEAEAVACLQHPHIVHIYDVGEQDGRPYFSMEYVEGHSLAQLLHGTPQPARQAASLVQTLARAIHTAHERGIVHRDLKPANILLTTETQRHREEKNRAVDQDASSLCLGASVVSLLPKITDFGLAKHLDLAAGQTASGMIVGTPSYMAPEQADAKRQAIGPAADVYALGAILYELLTGRPPFRAETPLETLRQVLSEEPIPLSQLQRKTPRDLNTVCMKCLRKEPLRRYRTALALAEDLERFLANQPIHARRTPAWERTWRWCRRNPAVAGLALAVTSLLLTVAVGASLGMLRLRTEQESTLAQLHRSEQAEANEKRRLFAALLAQARASRTGQRLGRRFQALDLVTEASQLARSLNLGEEEFRKLRTEAASCLALADLRVDYEWPGSPDGTFCIAFDGNLGRYARVDTNQAVSVRRVANDEELYHLPGMGPRLAVTAFSEDGRFLVLLGDNQHMRLWRVTGTTPVQILEAHDASNVSFSPDSRLFALARPDGTIAIHNLESTQQTARLRTTRPVNGLAFSPVARQLAAGCTDGIQVLDLDTGRVVAQFGRGVAIGTPTWHPEGKLLAGVEANSNRITVWDVPRCEPRLVLEGHTDNVSQVVFNHAGDLLASDGWDEKLRIWDIQTGKQLIETPSRNAVRFAFSPDDRRLAAVRIHNKVQILEVAANRAYRTLARHPDAGKDWYRSLSTDPPSSVASSRQSLIAAGAGRRGFGLWDLATGREAGFVKLPESYEVLFDPSGALLTNRADGVWRWPARHDAVSPGRIRLGPPERLPLRGSTDQIASSADGRVLATAQRGQGGLVWHAGRADPVRLFPHGDVRFIAVSPNGRLVATGSHHGTGVKVWDSQSGALVKELLVGVPHTEVAFSPDGKWLATLGGIGCRLWAVDSWNEGPPIGGVRFAFSPDSALLAVETGTGVIALVNPGTGREYVRLEDPNQHRANLLRFSSEGTRLVTINIDDNSLHVWDLQAVRRELADLGLDWDMPPWPAFVENPKGPPLQLHVDSGELRDNSPPGCRETLITSSLAIAFQPLNPESYYRRALAYTLLEEWPAALEDCNRSLALWPDHVETYYLRAQVCHRLGQSWQALDNFREGVRHEPHRLPSPEELQRALILQADVPGELNELAWQYVTGLSEQQYSGLATLLAEKVVMLMPGSWEYLNTLGIGYYRLGRWPQAVKTLEESLRRSQGASGAYDLFFLAMAYHRLGQSHRARDCYQRGIRWCQEHGQSLSLEPQELASFRAEAAALLGLPKPSEQAR